jgi:hypothetical protein
VLAKYRALLQAIFLRSRNGTLVNAHTNQALSDTRGEIREAFQEACCDFEIGGHDEGAGVGPHTIDQYHAGRNTTERDLADDRGLKFRAEVRRQDG